MHQLAPVERRRAWIFLTGMALLVLTIVVIFPLLLVDHRQSEALSDVVGRLERYERRAAARPILEKKLEEVRAQNTRRLFLKAPAASLAAAEMQERVRQLLDASGARIVSVQIGQPKDDGRFRQVGVTVQFQGTVGNLRSALAALEGSEPYMVIDSLTVRNQTQGFRPVNAAVDPELFVQVEILAFAVAN